MQLLQFPAREGCTAHAALLARAASFFEPDVAVRHSDYLAPAFLKHAVDWSPSNWEEAKQVRDYREKCVPGIYYYHLARTRCVDRMVLDQLFQRGDFNAAQLVILGAGFDSRAIRFQNQLAGRPVIEVDMPLAQQSKLIAVRQLESFDQSCLTFVPADLAAKDLEQRLVEFGFNPKARSVFILEGVSYYLDRTALMRVFDLVSRSESGSSLVFDFIDEGVLGNKSADYGYGTAEHIDFVEELGEPFLCGLPRLPNSMATLLRSHGLRLGSIADSTTMERTELVCSDNTLLGRISSHLLLAQAFVP